MVIVARLNDGLIIIGIGWEPTTVFTLLFVYVSYYRGKYSWRGYCTCQCTNSNSCSREGGGQEALLNFHSEHL